MELKKTPTSTKPKNKQKKTPQQPGLSPLHKKRAAFRQLSSAGRTDFSYCHAGLPPSNPADYGVGVTKQ